MIKFNSACLFIVLSLECFMYNSICRMEFVEFMEGIKNLNLNVVWSEEWCLVGCYAVWLL
jgi:hypothetical protein